ncbi:MAG: Uma2 family endonuclease [Acidobacteria bacterium]|nr:Uma2 family endonuclease [Acidobacteriota bacterium]
MNVALQETELPVRLRFEQPVSDEELLQFCERNHLLRVERDANGELILMSPTGTDGGNAELDIATELNLWARQDGRGRALGPNSGIRLPDTAVLAADAGWVSWERYNATAGQSGFREFVPEFVIELRSESDRLADVRSKMERWMAYGVEVGWLIDPSRRVVEVYRPGREVEVVEGGSVVEGDGPVAGFVLELGMVWG